jgi:hypothetical protein
MSVSRLEKSVESSRIIGSKMTFGQVVKEHNQHRYWRRVSIVAVVRSTNVVKVFGIDRRMTSSFWLAWYIGCRRTCGNTHSNLNLGARLHRDIAHTPSSVIFGAL